MVIEYCMARNINVGGVVTHLTIYTFVEFNENEFVADINIRICIMYVQHI